MGPSKKARVGLPIHPEEIKPETSYIYGRKRGAVFTGYGRRITRKYVYEGELKNGLAQGLEKMTWVNGNVYKGEFKNNKLNGFGKISFKESDTYEGEFIDDKFHGVGKHSYVCGSKLTEKSR